MVKINKNEKLREYATAQPKSAADPATSCRRTWFAGGSTGYVARDADMLDTLHVGVKYKCPTSKCSQSIFLEVGYYEKDFRVGANDALDIPLPEKLVEFDGEIEVNPITFNYKYECDLTDKLNWYIGAGAGAGIARAEMLWRVLHKGKLDPSFGFGL